MQHPRGRYVKLNIVDYLLIAAAVLLLLALLFRGVGMLVSGKAEICRADVEFAVRGLDEARMEQLIAEKAPFLLADGSSLAAQFETTVHQETMLVWNEDGSMTEAENPSAYRVIVSFTAEGELANDGTFLFGGTRRLATGEALVLTQAQVTYTADVVRVSVRGG